MLHQEPISKLSYYLQYPINNLDFPPSLTSVPVSDSQAVTATHSLVTLLTLMSGSSATEQILISSK